MWIIEFYKYVEIWWFYNGVRLNKCLVLVWINKMGNNCLIKDFFCKKKKNDKKKYYNNEFFGLL